MKRGEWKLSVLTCGLLLCGVAASAAEPQACGVQTLNGTFGYHYKGTLARSDALDRLAAVGLVTFSGAGKLTGADTYSLGGKIERRKYEGTYTVKPDCTGSATFETAPRPTRTDFVVLDDANELQFTLADEGTSTLGIAKRQALTEPCHVGRVLGSYGFALDGYYFFGPLVGYMTLSGIYTTDGKGHVRVADTASHNGTVERRQYGGTYTLEPNCTGVWESTLPDGRTFRADFLIVGDGIFEGYFIVTEPGTVLSGADKKIQRPATTTAEGKSVRRATQ
jgi:hypothetical protein